MSEPISDYVEYLYKSIETLDKCIKILGELKIEAKETLNELKNNELPEHVKEDKEWQELMLRLKRVQMVVVEARMSHVLSVLRREVEKLEHLKSELKITKGETKKSERK